MTKFSMVMIFLVVAGCFAGYETASRDLLQQVFLARKLTHRLAECLCAAMALLIQMFFSPWDVLCIIPAAVIALYVLGTFALGRLFQRKESDLCTSDHRRMAQETTLCTFISCLAFVGSGFLVCRAAVCLQNIAEQLSISTVDQAVCCGMSMGVNALLLATLVHYLLVLRMYPSDDENPSRELLRLRKALRVPHRI